MATLLTSFTKPQLAEAERTLFSVEMGVLA
jgi:hypothetical protein